MTMPGIDAMRAAASSASARFSASAARNLAAPNIFTGSHTRKPWNPRDRSGPYWLGS